MIIFLALLLAHLLYDFHWQGPFIAEMKAKNAFLLWVHALTWALLLGAVLWAFGALAWWHVPFLGATHYTVDYWKAHQHKLDPLGPALWIDQAAHVVTMILVVVTTV